MNKMSLNNNINYMNFNNNMNNMNLNDNMNNLNLNNNINYMNKNNKNLNNMNFNNLNMNNMNVNNNINNNVNNNMNLNNMNNFNNNKGKIIFVTFTFEKYNKQIFIHACEYEKFDNVVKELEEKYKWLKSLQNKKFYFKNKEINNCNKTLKELKIEDNSDIKMRI